MKCSIVLSIVFALFYFHLISTSCPIDYCKLYTCQNETSCAPGQTLELGGPCSCCMVCFTILKKGDKCYDDPVDFSLYPNTYCGSGLKCKNGTCIECNKKRNKI